MPSDGEIRRVRRLIARVRDEMNDLSGDDKQRVLDAVNVVRRHRKTTVALGMPRVRQPRPDLGSGQRVATPAAADSQRLCHGAMPFEVGLGVRGRPAR